MRVVQRWLEKLTGLGRGKIVCSGPGTGSLGNPGIWVLVLLSSYQTAITTVLFLKPLITSGRAGWVGGRGWVGIVDPYERCWLEKHYLKEDEKSANELVPRGGEKEK